MYISTYIWWWFLHAWLVLKRSMCNCWIEITCFSAQICESLKLILILFHDKLLSKWHGRSKYKLNSFNISINNYTWQKNLHGVWSSGLDGCGLGGFSEYIVNTVRIVNFRGACVPKTHNNIYSLQSPSDPAYAVRDRTYSFTCRILIYIQKQKSVWSRVLLCILSEYFMVHE